MTRRDALREGIRFLAEEGQACSDSPSLDASLLLASALATTKEGLMTSLPDPIPGDTYIAYRGLLARRARGMPVAYILGRKEFWGHDFLVDERVLIPRPDTELLVELALSLGDRLAKERAADGIACHEACTGSGCVAISLALERPAWKVSASDLSTDALAVAEANARLLLPPSFPPSLPHARPGGPVKFFHADLLHPLTAGGRASIPVEAWEHYDLVVANPPYVESPEAKLLSEHWKEPLMALDGGVDGLDPYRRLIPEASRALSPGGWLLVEADPSQASPLALLFTEAGFVDIKNVDDLAGLARVTLGRMPWTT